MKFLITALLAVSIAVSPATVLAQSAPASPSSTLTAEQQQEFDLFQADLEAKLQSEGHSIFGVLQSVLNISPTWQVFRAVRGLFNNIMSAIREARGNAAKERELRNVLNPVVPNLDVKAKPKPTDAPVVAPPKDPGATTPTTVTPGTGGKAPGSGTTGTTGVKAPTTGGTTGGTGGGVILHDKGTTDDDDDSDDTGAVKKPE